MKEDIQRKTGKQLTQIQKEALWEDKDEWRRPTVMETSINDYDDGEKISTAIVFAKSHQISRTNVGCALVLGVSLCECVDRSFRDLL